jgi:hypothetical protein
MIKKIICILVMTLLITTVFPVIGIQNEFSEKEINTDKIFRNIFLSKSENGLILSQLLNENGKGYTVMRLSGSYYEMGFAHAELLGDYIVQGVDETKDILGANYNSIKSKINDSVWMPLEIEDELDGMVNSLAITHPSVGIDKDDLKVYNTIGDWSYSFACRSHTCWGRYVEEPIKTLSTRRLDFVTPSPIANHHLLCIYYPDDGSTKWVNLAIPGYVAVATAFNEYGTISSSHDWSPMSSPDLSPDRMPRVVALRYALTYPTDPDLSTHLNSVFSELQNYEIMTMSFLNYYVPEGYGGVMTCDPWQGGPDVYNLRLPQGVWHHGEAMITTNRFTDGTYTPSDEDFGADTYYNDETPKTLESHWNLLDSKGGSRNLHLLSLAYRDRGDMTIWAEGRIDGVGRTQRLEYEWNTLFYTEPPNAPYIDGPQIGNPGVLYEYVFNSFDPDGDDVKFYIDWGDNCNDVTDLTTSGTDLTVSHTWTNIGKYTITVYAEDANNLTSRTSTFEITIPRNKVIANSFLNWLQNHPNMFPLLQKVLQQFGL